MRETEFIRQNKEKWQEFEKQMASDVKDADKLSQLFIEINDDLSYARTFYKNRSIRLYLNNIAKKLFLTLNTGEKLKKNFLKKFWTEELPAVIYQSRFELLTSLGVFLISLLIGIVSSFHDHSFAGLILGDSYVQETIQNIKKGNAMAIYKDMNQTHMFLGITLNNLRVAFLSFVLGLLFGVGTFSILLYNGIMVGVFQFFFYKYGLLYESFLTIWMHGTIEISSIIIAGGAGFTLSKGLLFPGTYSRMQSLQLSARRSIMIMAGITPLIILAGFIESFLTRYTEFPVLIKGSVIFGSLFFIIYYFVYYPIKKSRKGFNIEVDERKLKPNPPFSFREKEIKSTGEIFKNVFDFFVSRSRSFFMPALLCGFIYIGVCYAIDQLTSIPFRGNSNLFFLNRLFDFENHLWKMPLNILLQSFVTLFVYFNFRKHALSIESLTWKNVLRKKTGLVLFAVSVFNLSFITPLYAQLLIYFVGMPFVFLWFGIIANENTDLFRSISRSWKLGDSTLSKTFGCYYTLLISGFIFLLIIYSPLIYLNIKFLNWSLKLSEEWQYILSDYAPRLLVYTGFTILYMQMLTAFLMLYYSLREICEANELKRRIHELVNNYGFQR
jgi:uncharacterized membrane protein SpoIIM required for sporulation